MSLIPEETLTEIRQRLRAHHEPLTFSCGEACFVLAHHDVRALLDENEQLRAELAEVKETAGILDLGEYILANQKLAKELDLLRDKLETLERCEARRHRGVVADSPTPDEPSKVTTSDDCPDWAQGPCEDCNELAVRGCRCGRIYCDEHECPCVDWEPDLLPIKPAEAPSTPDTRSEA